MCIGIHGKYPLFLSDFDETFNFLDRFSKNTEISNFITNHPVGAELFHAGGRTDGHDELIVTFRSFKNAPARNRNPIPPPSSP